MRHLDEDYLWPVSDPAATDRCIMNAEYHRDLVAAHLRRVAAMRAGVTAAQIMDFFITAPELLASGESILAALAKWLTETGGGGPASIRIVSAGGEGILALTTAVNSRLLTAAEIEALRAAGLLSGKAYAVYSVAQGGGSGAHPGGSGPPGPKGGSGKVRTDDPALRGANITDPEKVDALRKSMMEQGFKMSDNPVVILETNLYGNQTIKLVVDGNNRLIAARSIGKALHRRGEDLRKRVLLHVRTRRTEPAHDHPARHQTVTDSL
jgi:hypothetical protein